MKRTIDELIKEFAETQNKLCQSVIKEYDLVADSDVVFKTPMTGSLILDGAQWTFRRHGLGLRFINHESGYVIDAHRNFVTSPSGFDAWRLMQAPRSPFPFVRLRMPPSASIIDRNPSRAALQLRHHDPPPPAGARRLPAGAAAGSVLPCVVPPAS